MQDEQARWVEAARLRRRLERYLSWRTDSPEDAQDAAAEAISRVGQARDIRDSEHLLAWLRVVGVRVSVDERRRRRTPEQLAALAPPAAVAGADEEVLDRALARQVAAEMDRLPADQRAAMLARADGRSLADIAREMGRTPKAVERLLARGRQAVKAAVDPRRGAAVPLGVRRWRLPRLARRTGAAVAATAVVALAPSPHVSVAAGSTAASPPGRVTIAVARVIHSRATRPGVAGRRAARPRIPRVPYRIPATLPAGHGMVVIDVARLVLPLGGQPLVIGRDPVTNRVICATAVVQCAKRG
jgi:RNA polymerase sigma factor (sigma-70 family)